MISSAMMSEFILRKGTEADGSAVLEMYRSAIGAQGSVWDENYPTELEIAGDLAAGTLYVFEKAGTLAGAVSVVPENELDELDCWRETESCCEIARVVISPEFRGKGLSSVMVGMLADRLKAEGIRSIHLLVARDNLIARRTYASLGFEFYGDCFMFGHYHTAAEKLF